ncbi:hypothetical protein R3I94_008784 [Phoxinus phoxinus]
MEKVSRKKTTIGIFGRSGEGKSSLLNAVLGKKDLLPMGCFGACTAVVTQVEANLEDSNYIAEIELFSKEEWEKELKYLFSVLSDESKDRNEDLYDMAVEKITALYGDDAAKKTLEELKKDDKFAEIETLLSISKKISKSDVFEFSNEVASYTQHSESSSGDWYWPIVKCVTIKIPDCQELLEHIALVDIPGTGDCNKIRDDKWKSKLRECSFVWIVNNINRAITDKDPWGILKHCTKELGLGGECKRINFICTKTDEINPAAYVRSASLITDQLKDQEKVCILHRNEHAKMKIKEKFENSDIKKIVTTDDDFLVFTVSSKAFFDPNLKLEPSESEIPKLQDDLRILNKNITRDYINEAKGLLSLIQSVQPDTDKEMVQMKEKVFMEFEESLMKALKKLDIWFDTIYSVLDQCLSKGVEKSVELCDASTEAMIKTNKVKVNDATIRALCRNGGCYFSKGRNELLDLNKALYKNLHECLEEDFTQIFPVNRQTGKSVQEQIDKFSIMQTHSDYFRFAMLNHIQKFLQTEETKLKASLNREVIDKKKDIILSIQTTIENEMASYYKQAAEIRGAGARKKMQDLLITAVNNIKQDMFNKAKNEVLKKFNNLKLYIKNALESGLKTSIKLALSQTSKVSLMDVSREIEQLESLTEQ